MLPSSVAQMLGTIGFFSHIKPGHHDFFHKKLGTGRCILVSSQQNTGHGQNIFADLEVILCRE